MAPDPSSSSPPAPDGLHGSRGESGGAPERVPVSVVLPAFDEEQGLRATLEELKSVLHGTGRACEIIVVDDGSTDATPRILAACPDVTVVRHAANRGYGAALKTGIRAARHPLVVVMDADGTYAAAAIPALVDRCATADMVVGARIGRNVQAAPARGLAKWCFRQFAQWITGAAIPDLNSGLRVFDRAVAERFMELLPDGFSFTTTITVASILERLVVRFEAVDYMPRLGRSKVRPLRDTARIARQLLRLGWQFAPLRTSVTVALPLFVVCAGSSAHHLHELRYMTWGDFAWLASCALALVAGGGAERQQRRKRCLAAADVVSSPRSRP